MEIRLRERLEGRSIYWLAKQTGIDKTCLKNLCENKSESISFNTLVKICQCLKCKPNDILEVDE